MSDTTALHGRRTTLCAEVANMTVRVRELRKAMRKAPIYRESLTVAVVLAKAEYELALAKAELFDIQGEITQIEGDAS